MIRSFLPTDRNLHLAMFGIAWFWFLLAAWMQFIRLHAPTATISTWLLLPVFGFAVAWGLYRHFSGVKKELGLVPLGSIGLSVVGFSLFWHTAPYEALNLTGGRVFLMGLFAGFYVIPLYEVVGETKQLRILFTNRILNFFFALVGIYAVNTYQKSGFSPANYFFTLALMNTAVAVFIYSLLPVFLLRLVAWLVSRFLYRIEEKGLENLPETGAAVVVCNHVGFMDAFILGGTVRRPLRFVMYYKIYQLPVLHALFKAARTIPIAGAKEDPTMMERAFAEVAAALAAGEIVGIFPEGGLTKNGEIQPFKAGIERILKTTPVPVIPMAMRGVWGSLFSRQDSFLGRSRLPRRFWSKLEVVAAPAIPAEQASAAHLESVVRGLRGDWA
jgi:hypothetical protein